MLIRTNVINIGDPFILNDGKHYYMYSTDFDVEGFKVRISDDLINWQSLGIALDLSDSWAYKSFWAPEVVKHQDKYVMHYSARSKENNELRIGVATADSPVGPFIDVHKGPMFELGYAVIDGHVLKEGNNYYLFYSRDCSTNLKEDGYKTSQIYAYRLSDDLLNVIGEPVLITTPDKTYDTVPHGIYRWNEGPAIIYEDNEYYLTYSANFYASNDYCICLAKANNPLGPYIKQDDINPIVKAKPIGNDFSGPGHNCFFRDFNNNLKMAFHIQTDENHSSQDRKAVIADVIIKDGKMIVEI